MRAQAPCPSSLSATVERHVPAEPPGSGHLCPHHVHPCPQPPTPARFGAPMATTRAPVPPTSDTRQVGGTNGHHPCTHAPNLRVAAAREQAWGSNRHPARLAAALCPASPTRSSPAPRCHAIAGYSEIGRAHV